MQYLMTEIALLLLATAVIAWLGGRFLCKRGEKELRIKTNQLSGKHAALSDQFSKLESQYQRLKTKSEKLESDAEQQLFNESQLRTEVEGLRQDKQEASSRLMRMEGYRTELNSLRTEVESLRVQLMQERSEHDAALQQSVELEEENAELRYQLDQLTNKSDTLHIEVSKLNLKSVDYQERLHEALRTHSEMSEANRELSRRCEMLAEQVAGLGKERDAALAKLRGMQNDQKAGGEELAQAKDEIVQLTARIQAVEEERDSYEARLARPAITPTPRPVVVAAPQSNDVSSLKSEMDELRAMQEQMARQLEVAVMQNQDYQTRLKMITSVLNDSATPARSSSGQ